jgi:predicted RNase H-like HicB family nuclease
MRIAKYKVLPESKKYFGEIPELRSVYTCAETIDVCRRELEEAPEGWILIRTARGIPIPEINLHEHE